jgi:tRNA nucleotidyltransferase (CCA-adding enzyme)
MTADSLGRPPKDASEATPLIQQLCAQARALELESRAPRPLVLGRHLITLGRTPGPEFKKILAAAFEAQLDGAFHDEAEGIEWARRHLAAVEK